MMLLRATLRTSRAAASLRLVSSSSSSSSSSPSLLASSSILRHKRPVSYCFTSTRTLVSRKDIAEASTPTMVKIGHVELDLRDHYPSTAPHLIPKFYLPHDYHNVSPTILSHLQWILSKDVLGQDMMLVGPPGSGAGERRQLALMYAEMTRREVEILTISADVTESDLKQRKELVVVRKSNNTNHNANTTATATATATTVEFQDQAPVRAALHGRLLILDGLEKAERNVLPTLNNLLENREMNLDDGRLLVSPKRYQDLRLQHDPGFLVPIHPSFRVVALTTPAPPFPGKGLDPPLRSRFQIRRVDSPSAEELYQELSLSLPTALTNDENGTQDYHRICQTFSAFGAAMNSATMKSFSSSSSGGRTLVFPTNTLQASAQILQTFPHENPRNLLARSYPFCNTAKLQMGSNNDADASKRSFKRACDELHIGGGSLDDPDQFWDSTYNIQSIERSRDNPRVANVAFLSSTDASIVEAQVACGTNKLNRLSPSRFVQTEGTQSVLVSMIQEHSVARDILLVSPRGEGKSTIAKQFASMLGYNMLVFNLYKEMTARDLLQRRSTDPISGETKWEDSALVKAACAGDLCILDGVERIGSDTFATLHSLLTERELSLPDGTRLVRSDRAVDSAASLNNNKVRPIHSSFRVIALASLSASKHVYSSRNYKWLSDDVMSMTSILSVPTPSLDCMKAILSSANPNFPESVINKLLLLRTTLVEDDTALDCGVQPLSTRNLLRIVRLQNNNNNNSTHTDAKDLYGAIGSVLLADLLPPTQRAALDTILNNHGIIQSNSKRDGSKHPYSLEQIEINENKVSIGNVAFQRHCNVRRPEMVPKPEFVDIPNQIHAIKGLLKEMNAGERAFLLLGNQGVGKNKITDRLCEVANLEREYVQLHRDSTIGSLTLSPSLEDGKIIWKDSPLIRAVQDGVVLVVDEADKAPLEVVAVLKSLVEDGELLLADGRRISRYEKGDGIIEMHPDFTLFVLANRPGYPFHGNDSFREIGDCFSVQVIANPDLESEMSLLRKYAPDIGNSLIRQIASSFDHLRGMADHGDISYPYSTREAVAVVKHLQAYPDDGVVAAIHNVLDFDSFDDSTYSIIGGVFNHHGIQMSSYSSWRVAQARLRAAASERGLEIEYTKQRETEGVSSSPPLLSSPHKGRWDDKNEAHVGGNQWAGGTGGSDTAGLGGRGGPYRLDRGHKVHQVSDEAKAAVSEEAKKAARAMAKKALKEKLDSIAMSSSEWDIYSNFLKPIKQDINILRNTLKSVEGKKAEKSWIKFQNHGEIDDSKLVDGVAGEKYIYKRRGVDLDSSSPLQNPKRLRFVVDASASMYRFNSYDGRLNRSLEATLMIMLAFDGMRDRFDYSIVGHSGDSPSIPLVHFNQPPQNEKEMMRILQNILAHTQYCQSGDYTLEAIEQAIGETCSHGLRGGEDLEETVVVAISDANLSRYGISPQALGKIMAAGTKLTPPVKAHAIFIASFGQEAEEIKRSLPAGRGHICMDSSDLPRIVRDILTSSAE